MVSPLSTKDDRQVPEAHGTPVAIIHDNATPGGAQSINFSSTLAVMNHCYPKMVLRVLLDRVLQLWISFIYCFFIIIFFVSLNRGPPSFENQVGFIVVQVARLRSIYPLGECLSNFFFSYSRW